MDILTILSSLNKISLVAFFITIGFLVFELRQLRRDKAARQTPIIPQFDPSISATPIPPSIVVQKGGRNKIHIILFPILAVMMVFFGILTVMSLFNQSRLNRDQSKPDDQKQNQISVQEVKSAGIRIFDSRWKEITGESTTALKAGDKVYIGVAMIRGTDIDRARIKVNQSQWQTTHITDQFNSGQNVFYKEYTLLPTDRQLQIEAQLHSKTKGWLSE